MQLEDFVFLGTAVPEESRRYGFTVCVAGFSPSLRSFLRLYPMPWPRPASIGRMRWEMYSVEVERPAADSRAESWKVVPADWSRARYRGRYGSERGIDWLRTHQSASIASLNDCRLSLGVLICAPRALRLCGREHASVLGSRNGHAQGQLFAEHAIHTGPVTKGQIPSLPMLSFDDSRGGHELQLIDWGSFLLLHKRYDLDALAAELRIGDATRAHALLLGNQENARRAWLVIACIPVPAAPGDGAGTTLPLFSPREDAPDARR
jgi:hypothetical protein